MPKYIVNGAETEVKDTEVSLFESEHPDASAVYYADGRKFAIPSFEREGFLKAFPNATMEQPEPAKEVEVSAPMVTAPGFTPGAFGGDIPTIGAKGKTKHQTPKVQTVIPSPYSNEVVEKVTPEVEDELAKSTAVGVKPSVAGGQYKPLYTEAEIAKAGEPIAPRPAYTPSPEQVVDDAQATAEHKYDRWITGQVASQQDNIAKLKAGLPKKIDMQGNYVTPVSEQSRYLDVATRILEDAERAERHYEKQQQGGSRMGNLGRGAASTLFDADTWLFGLESLDEGRNIKRVIDRAESGETLTSAEQALLDAAALDFVVQAEHASKMGGWYKAGAVTGAMAPFMIEMAVNPAASLGKVFAERVAKAALKRGAKGSLARAGAIVARGAGDVVGSTIMGAMNPATYADALRRQVGTIKPTINEDGDVAYEGREDAEETPQAYGKALANAAIERYSEMFGGALGRTGEALARATKWPGWDLPLKGKMASRAVDFIKSGQWHGIAGESIEEVFGGALNAAIVGDTTWDDLRSPEYYKEIIGGLLPSSILFGAVGAASYKTPEKLAQMRFDSALRGAHMAGVSTMSIDKAVETEAGRMQFFDDLAANPNLTWQQKSAAAKYATAKIALKEAKDQKPDITAENRVFGDELAVEYDKGVAAFEASFDGDNTYKDNIIEEYRTARSGLSKLDGVEVEDIDSIPNSGIFEYLQAHKGDARQIWDYLRKRQQYVALTESEKDMALFVDLQGDIERGREQGMQDAQEDIESVSRQAIAQLDNIAEHLTVEERKALDNEGVKAARSVVDTQAAAEYLHAQAYVEGLYQGAMSQAPAIGERVAAEVMSAAHPDGRIYNAQSRDGKQYNVVSGRLGVTEEGKVSMADSDAYVIVVDPATGERAMVAPREIESVEVENANVAAMAASAEASNRYAQTIKALFNTPSERQAARQKEAARKQMAAALKVGSEVNIAIDGAIYPAEITSIDNDIVTIDFGSNVVVNGKARQVHEFPLSEMASMIQVVEEPAAEQAPVEVESQATTPAEVERPVGQKIIWSELLNRNPLEFLQLYAERFGKEDARAYIDAYLAKKQQEIAANKKKQASAIEDPDKYIALKEEQELLQTRYDMYVAARDEFFAEPAQAPTEKADVEGARDGMGVNGNNYSDIQLSDEVDVNGRQFVLSSTGDIAFGYVTDETGLTPAPILLSEGLITNPATNDGYGLVHIEARHGAQIRQAGYPSVIDFINEVAKNYDIIREGSKRAGRQTYMLQLTDKHNNTLMVELSGDGTYWNINTAGVFKTSYGKNKKVVYNRQTTGKQFAETVGASQGAEQSGTQTPSSLIDTPTPSVISDNKDNALNGENQIIEQENVFDVEGKVVEWSEKLGIPAVVYVNVEDIPNTQAREAINNGTPVRGWYDVKAGTVAFYAPNLSSDAEVNEVFIHEVVAHKGLRGLLGKQYDTLCQRVWDMMSDADRDRFLQYPGVNGDVLAAADEYIAHLAEKTEFAEAEQSIWADIVAFVKEFLAKLNIGTTLTDEDLSNLLQMSYRRLSQNAQRESARLAEDGKGGGRMSAAQVAEEQGVSLPTQNGEQALFSIGTYEQSGRDKLASFIKGRIKARELTEQEGADIVKQMDALYDVCTTVMDKYEPFGNWSYAAVVVDEQGKPVFSVIKANGDYAMNLDFSLVCKKRRTLDAVFRRMIDRGIINNYELGQVDLAKINQIIREHGFETACRLCFVDAKRFRVAQVADAFCDMYNPLTKMSDKQLREVSKKEGNSTIGKTARMLLKHPENKVELSRENFMDSKGFEDMAVNSKEILKLYNAKKGAGGPKASYGDTQYMNDILGKKWTPESAYAVGGVRLQSFSDYVPRMVFDYMQMVADIAAKKLPVHSYTKEPIFAKQFGLTGIKINLSLVPRAEADGIAPGLDAEGNYAWQEGETFPYEEAIAIQNADGYKANCGTIAVGVSDTHIEKMLSDENIRMVIPYHKSGLNLIVAKFNNIDAFKDYTNEQNTRNANGTKLNENQMKSHFNFNADLHKHGDPRKAADNYLKWCDKMGYIPKFDKFRDHPNYYKLLEDFTTCVTENGVDTFVPQGPVTMTFPDESSAFGSIADLIEQGLEEDAVLEGNRQADLDNIVDDIVEAFDGAPIEESEDWGNKKDTKWGLRFSIKPEDIPAQFQPGYSAKNAVSAENEERLKEMADMTSAQLSGGVREEYGYNCNSWLEAMAPVARRGEGFHYYRYVQGLLKAHPELDFAARLEHSSDKEAIAEIKQQFEGITDLTSVKLVQDAMLYYAKGVVFNSSTRFARAVNKAAKEQSEAIKEEMGRVLNVGTSMDVKRGEVSIEWVKETFDKLNKDEAVGALFERVYDVAKQLKLRVAITNLRGTTRGEYFGDFVRYDARMLNSNLAEDQAKATVLLHELIHSVTSYAIYAAKDSKAYSRVKTTPEMVKAVRILDGVYGTLKLEGALNEMYAMTNVSEMVAELSNPAFREELKKRNLWQKIVDAIKAIFGLDRKTDDTMLTAASDALEYLLDNFDRAAYNRYLTLAMNTDTYGKMQSTFKKMEESVRFSVALTPEEQAIVDKAKADGTYLKALNGKATNLTPKQWAQVRTEAFKKWFGDWEKAARIEKLRNSKSAEISGAEFQSSEDMKQYRQNALEYGKTLRGAVVNADTGSVIVVNTDSVKEVLHHDGSDIAHIQSVAAIPQIIENGIYITTEPVSATASKRLRNAQEAHYYVCGLNIGRTPYTVKFVVAEFESGEKYYDHSLTQIEKGELLNRAEVSSTVAESKSPISDVKDKRLLSILQTNSSKIVDENGEPLVVWHGGTFAVDDFVPETPMHFGTKTAAFARILDTQWGFDNYEVSQNADGKWGWKYTDPNDAEYDKSGDAVYDSREEAMESAVASMDGDFMVKPYFLNLRKIEQVKDLDADWSGDIARGIREGLDGFSYTNDVEDPGSISYVAFEPTSIKSATDNVGTFDDANPDVRFSIGSIPVQEERAVGAAYDARMSDRKTRLREMWFDNDQSVRELQETIENATGEKIADFENVYLQRNHASARSNADIAAFEQLQAQGVRDAINRFVAIGVPYEDVVKYVMARHGLERNDLMSWREAVKARAEIDYENARKRDAELLQTAEMLGLPKPTPTAKSVNEYMQGYFDRYYDAVRDMSQEEYNERRRAIMASIVPFDMAEDKSGFKELFDDGIPEGETVTNEKLTALAEEYAQQFEAAHGDLVSGLWGAIQKVNDYNLAKAQDTGLKTEQQIKRMRDMYRNYIPLRGWAEDKAEDMYDYVNTSKTGVYNSLSATAEGRDSVADDPFATLSNIAYSTIVQGNRNRANHALLNLARNHQTDLLIVSGTWEVKDPDTGKWEIETPQMGEHDSPEVVMQKVREFETDMEKKAKAGNARRVSRKLSLSNLHFTNPQMQQHSVTVFSGGIPYTIWINGNPRAAQVINGLDRKSASDSKVANAYKKAMRAWASVTTAKNPEFIVSNASRDFGYSRFRVIALFGWDYYRKFRGNYYRVMGDIAGLMKGNYQARAYMGTPQSNLEKYWFEFVRNGGETGYAYIKNVDDLKKDIQKGVDEVQRGLTFGKAYDSTMGKMLEAIGQVSAAIELIPRFAAYVTSREENRSILKAIADAKEATTNFDRKGGSATQAMGNLYAFFNASMQGLENFAYILKKNPKRAWALLVGYATTGAMVGLMSAVATGWLFGEDPEDVEDKYWALSDFTRRSNLCLYLGDAGWLKIPLAHNLRSFYALGDIMLKASRGYSDFDNIAADVAELALGMLPLNPLDAGKSLGSVAPTMMSPIVDWMTNTDFTGRSIANQTDYNAHLPEWKRVYRTTPETAIIVSRFISELGGGNSFGRGATLTEINPDKMTHLLKGYLGGLWTTIDKSVYTAKMATESIASLFGLVEAPDWRMSRTLILSRLFQDAADPNTDTYVNRAYAVIRAKHGEWENEYKGFGKHAPKSDNDRKAYAEARAVRGGMMQIGRLLDDIDRLYKVRRTAESVEEQRVIEQQIHDKKRTLIEVWKLTME